MVTAESSSRWAGWVTKSSNDAWNLACRNQRRHLQDLEKAVSVLEEKLRLPVRPAAERKALVAAERERARAGNRAARRLAFGYRSAHEHAMKRRRLEHLRCELARGRADAGAGVVRVTRGGKQLLRTRLHLEQARLSEDQWRAKWTARRWSFGANGESGKRFGNETIRLAPDGTLEVDLPPALAHLANVTGRGVTRYRFCARVSFSYRKEEWLAQVTQNRAVAYDVVFAETGRVYLDASFTPAGKPEVPGLGELLADPALRVLAVDLNHGFLAPAVVDRAGNPVSRLPHIPLATQNCPASKRDGHLRQAITELLGLAGAHGCQLLVVEHLGFGEMRATGRERYGSRKWFRKVVCGLPTAQFRDRLVAMASRRGLAVAGVPAAYSSIWGAQWWQVPLSTTTHKVSGHTAAAVVLGRRALGHRARRRLQASPGVTAPGQRTEAGSGEKKVDSRATSSRSGAESYHAGNKGEPKVRHHVPARPQRHPGTHQTRSGEGERAGTSPAKTVRAEPKQQVSYPLLR